MKNQFECKECNRKFGDEAALNQHNSAKHAQIINKLDLKKSLKKPALYAMTILFAVAIVYGIYNLVSPMYAASASAASLGLPTQPIHWHPRLAIVINGQKQSIPANIGTVGGHQPIHTHDSTGVLHYENSNPTRGNMRLGYFFSVLGKQFNSNCIFNYCNGDSGTVKMLVNDKENLEFDDYIPKDGDNILIEYS